MIIFAWVVFVASIASRLLVVGIWTGINQTTKMKPEFNAVAESLLRLAIVIVLCGRVLGWW